MLFRIAVSDIRREHGRRAGDHALYARHRQHQFRDHRRQFAQLAEHRHALHGRRHQFAESLRHSTGRTIRNAYLYWGGSGTTNDTSVSLNGTTVTATRTFTRTFNNGTAYQFFGDFADVTPIVTAAGGNANYTFGNLTINTGAPWCASQAVVGGWALIVIYEGAAERVRAINIFDGLDYFYGSQVTQMPDGFRVPATNIDGRVAVFTLEGDPQNSTALNGINEALTFNGTVLDDGLVPTGSNPVVQQFEVDGRPHFVVEIGVTVTRACLSTPDDFLKSLSAKIEQLQRSPGRLAQTLEQSSLDVWTSEGVSGVNTNANTSVSYHIKGQIAGFLLDAVVQRATDGAKNLDAAMRLSYRRYGGTRGFTPSNSARRSRKWRAPISHPGSLERCRPWTRTNWTTRARSTGTDYASQRTAGRSKRAPMRLPSGGSI